MAIPFRIKCCVIFLVLLCSTELAINGFSQALRSITVNDGLTINEVTDLYQDRQMNYMWIGTQNGLNRYNGNQIQKYYIPKFNPNTSNFVNSITEDQYSRLWIGTTNGLACFDYCNNVWIELPQQFYVGNYSKLAFSESGTLIAIKNDSTLSCVDFDGGFTLKDTTIAGAGNLTDIAIVGADVILSASTGIMRFRPVERSFSYLIPWKNKHVFKLNYLKSDKALWFQSEQQWFRTPVEDENILIAETTRAAEFLNFESEIRGVAFNDDSYWIWASQGVIRKRKPIQGGKPIPDRQFFSNYSFRKIIFDNRGNLWGGTWQSGVCVRSAQRLPFVTFAESQVSGQGLESRLIRGFSELDTTRTIVATETKGLVLFDRYKRQFSKPYSAETQSSESLFSVQGNIMHVLKKDWKGRIWAGYHAAGFNVIYGGDKGLINRVIRKAVPEAGSIICDDILIDQANGKIYLITRFQVYEYNDATQTIKKISHRLDYLTCAVQASDGTIWLAGRKGMRVYRPNFVSEDEAMNEKLYQAGLLEEDVTSFYRDDEGNIWIGTYGNGLFVYDVQNELIRTVKPAEHYDFRIVYSIIRDDQGVFWMGTNNGLFSYNDDSGEFNRYTIEDGIQDNQFNYNSVFKTSDGTLFFGGISGFTYFNPAQIRALPKLAEPRISGLKIGDVPVLLFEHNEMIAEVKVPYVNGNFEFSFFTPDYGSPENYTYAYQLENYTTKEQYVNAASAKAAFFNVPPGRYRLKVRVSRSNGEWSDYAVSPVIIVLKPWYRTSWAYGAYILVVLMIFGLTIFVTRKTANFRNSLEIARLEKENTEKVSAAKLRFFTDIAHEIRTPLTLIFGPLNDLLARRKFDEPTMKTLTLMQRSSRQLLSLMDELLLFRKSENGELPLNLCRHNLSKLVNETCTLLTAEAESKGIMLVYPDIKDENAVVLDVNKMEKVLLNLVGNALKFTEKGGVVSVRYTISNYGFSIFVKDTGRGIADKDLERIFNRFYQSDQTMEKGFGIGLTLSKRIVNAHSGELVVESKIGEGSEFRLMIPSLVSTSESNQEQAVIQIPESRLEDDGEDTKREAQRGLLLVVEDNKDIREYIAGIFSAEFEIIQEENGRDGLFAARDKLPDIIISDYQMPVMDGIELCRKLKEDLSTSHIPVVLLSAFYEVENQLKGLQVGADDYIGKPFDRQVLRQKIINILEVRRQIIGQYKKEGLVDLARFEKPDQRFLDKVNRIIEREMANDQFDVPVLCEELGMGKTTLNDKLKAILDVTPAQYIRRKKLKEAYRLITEEGYSSANAAYAIGFSPSYFATSFKKEFGISPGQV